MPVGLWGYVRIFPRISQYLGYGGVRLDVLREQMGFDLEYVDVRAKPGVLTSKGIKAVPVVEVGDRRLVGHATSEQLAELVSG